MCRRMIKTSLNQGLMQHTTASNANAADGLNSVGRLVSAGYNEVTATKKNEMPTADAENRISQKRPPKTKQKGYFSIYTINTVYSVGTSAHGLYAEYSINSIPPTYPRRHAGRSRHFNIKLILD